MARLLVGANEAVTARLAMDDGLYAADDWVHRDGMPNVGPAS